MSPNAVPADYGASRSPVRAGVPPAAGACLQAGELLLA